MTSISISENGWTDKELGSMWIEKDFHPFSQERNTSNGYRLLILDGHNSHCTFKFCHFAEQHRIIIICLPSHTTHALQPCDVGVFSPLSTSWKTLVNRLTHDGIAVSKFNFLTHYHTARVKAFKPSTILSAFAKSGIWPINPHAIPLDAFEPAKNTTTQAAMPVSDSLTPLLEMIEDSESPSALNLTDGSNISHIAENTLNDDNTFDIFIWDTEEDVIDGINAMANGDREPSESDSDDSEATSTPKIVSVSTPTGGNNEGKCLYTAPT